MSEGAGGAGALGACLEAVVAFLGLDLLVARSGLFSVDHGTLELFAVPPLAGLALGLLRGGSWPEPRRSAALAALACLLAFTVPYAFDTWAVARQSDEVLTREVRREPALAQRTPAELRTAAVAGRAVSFLMFAPLVVCGLAYVGARAGQRLVGA